MAKQGMDVDQIGSDGTQMKSVGGDAIPQVISAIEGIVSQLQGTWWGPDSEAFVNNWNSTYKPHLNTIAQAVVTQGEAALTAVQQQRETSGATGSTA